MNLIWAFQFSPPLDAATGTPLPVDIFAYSKVRFVTTVRYTNRLKGLLYRV